MTGSDAPTNERRRSWVFILLALLLICGCVALVAGPGGPLVAGFFSGGDNPTQTPTPPVTCGDGVCSTRSGEDCTTCSVDCQECTPTITCGDGVCSPDAGETCDTCQEDCQECAPTTSCGDGTCSTDAGEDCKTCQQDCGDCPVTNPRGACLDACDPANSTCQTGLTCIPSASGSDQYVCWNQAICDVTSEPTCNNNGVCDPGEPANCRDCQQNPCTCGDGVCEQDRCGELAQTCPADCDVCVSNPSACNNPCAGAVCGDNICQKECGESYPNCRECG